MGSTIKLIFIMGPTASGKTDLAVKIAKGIGEIISVDSMQVYRGLICGTSKPTSEQLHDVPHYCIDIVTPNCRFSAGDFRREALNAIDIITSRGKIPFLVGGTGLYFRTIEYSLIDAPPADLKLRERFYLRDEQNPGCLYEELISVDRETAERLHPHDLVRIVRALEIYYLTRIPFSKYPGKSDRGKAQDFDILKIGIALERSILYEKIDKRCDVMLACGLAEEVKKLLERGYDERFPSMKGLGYSHFIQFYKGCYSWPETVRRFKRDTRRYAKRQITWFKKDPEIQWFLPAQIKEIKFLVEAFLGKYT